MRTQVTDMKDIQSRKRELSPLTHAAYIILFSMLMILSAVIQCSKITVFGAVPDITFALVCAIGFIAGERYGAVFGLIGGVMIMYLGSSGLSMAPIMFTLCAYLCGALPSIVLRRNFLSYLVFAAAMGAIHIFFSLIYVIMFSKSFEIWRIIGERMIPELLSCVILMIVAYAPIKLIYSIFKVKKRGMRV